MQVIPWKYFGIFAGSYNQKVRLHSGWIEAYD
jgi:hypothetical protein